MLYYSMVYQYTMHLYGIKEHYAFMYAYLDNAATTRLSEAAKADRKSVV